MKSILRANICAFFLLSLIFTVHSFAVSGTPKNFNGYQVLRIKIETADQFSRIENLTTLKPLLDFWSEPEIGKFCDVMVSPSELTEVTGYLSNHFDVEVFIPDVGKVIKEQSLTRVGKAGKRQQEDFWEDYQRLDVIFGWMSSLAESYPDLVSTQTIGFSYEQRPIGLLKISSNPSDLDRPAVFLDSGIHAREWISPATLTYLVDRLINDPQYADILQALDIHVVPVLNPDGYEYTHTTNRMWRKNRRPTEGSSCAGADLNRNFPFQWCTVGASNDSCAETFCGSGPGSEPETTVITDYLSQDVNWWGFVTLHSYAQEWCIPWAYTAEHHPDYDAMMAVGRQAVDALESTHGTSYTIKIPSGRYGGFSMDWAKGVRGIKYPVLIELRDTGRYGFLLPPDQIIPSGEETLAAIAAYLRAIIAEIEQKQKQ